MTASRIEEEAERDLARMNAAREAKRKPPKKAGADAPRARFISASGDALGRPGVYWVDVRRSDSGEAAEGEPQWICSPIEVAAVTRDVQSDQWGRLLVFPDRDGTVHRWAMPMSMLAGSGEELRGELLRQGLEITSHPERRRRLVDFLQWADPKARARCVLRTGWHGDVFVLPAETFGDTTEPVLFQGNAVDGVALGVAGTLDGWRANVAAACVGNSRLAFAVACAFAGPCLGLLDAEGGGVHLRGASSSGKSTALAAAASVFGPPAYVRNWRATDNALEGVAATHSDLLLALDEIGQLDPRAAGAAAYLLANGQGKARSNRDGSVRAPVRFRLLFLSAGELSLADLALSVGVKTRAGQEVRVIDVPAEPPGGAHGIFERVPDGMTAGEFADSLKHAAGEHHGAALRDWLRWLTDDPARAREALRACRDAMTDDLAGKHAVGQVRRVAAKFAVIAAAGELATAAGLTGWPRDEAARAARACFRDWLSARGTTGAAEPAAMLAQVRLYLAQHGESRFSSWARGSDEHAPRTVNRAGFRRVADDLESPGAFYVFGDVFRSEVCAGFDPAQVARALANAGALKLGSGGEATRKERLPDGTRARVYVVLPALFEDEGSDE